MTGALAAAQPLTTNRINAARPNALDAPAEENRCRLRTRSRLPAPGLRMNPIEQPARDVRVDHRPVALRHLAVDLGVPVQPDQPIAIRVLAEVELERDALLIERQP